MIPFRYLNHFHGVSAQPPTLEQKIINLLAKTTALNMSAALVNSS
jgi:hypothetical protein